MNPVNLKEVIEYTQDIRKRIADSMLSNGIPEDNDSLELLLKTLDSLDKSVFTKQKLTIDEGSLHLQKQAGKLISEVLNKFNMPKLEPVESIEIKQLNLELDDSEIVPGETFIGIETIDINSI